MARDKVTRSAPHRTKRPVRLQDSTSLAASLLQDLTLTIINPIVERVETVESILATLRSASIQRLDIELPRQRSGRVIVAGVFTEAQVGQPVLVTNGRLDDLDGVILFGAEVLDTRRLRVTWTSSTIPPRHVRIHYIIGSAEESLP